MLDTNVLIALSTPDHSAHGRAAAWFRNCPDFATCPITQGALIRFHLRWGASPSIGTAKDLIQICAMPSHLQEKGVVGHRQVTDAYLALLASAHGGILVTLDRALAAVHPNTVLISQ
ncbi:MAG TPA: VapC toxin family PIN domain ribonuclease [Bryobacteraceae bacterium]|nr:VapC toxin family PIN domain ribonuclease [Bryobacteraceae bacterium]